jgi:oligopeptide/dipeptide ABC transporter ATP-binding protein
MYLGRIVEVAPAQDIYTKPLHPYTRALLAAIPKPDPGRKQEFKPLPGDVPSALMPPSGCHFHPRCPYAQEICRQEYPSFKGLNEYVLHQATCHFVGQI